MSILDEYKGKINSNLRQLVGKSIAIIRNKQIYIESINNYGHITIQIKNDEPETEKIQDIKIKITTRITENSGDIRLAISFSTRNKRGHENTCYLAKINKQNEIKLMDLVWIPRRTHPADHYNYWWGRGEAQISSDLEPIQINLIRNTIEIKSIQQILVLNKNEFERINKWEHNLFRSQAKSIALRCVDWFLYNVQEDAEIDILINNKPVTTAIGNIFNSHIDDIKNIDKSINKSSSTEKLTPYTLKRNCEAQGLFYSHDVYQIVANSMNLGRHLILTGPPGCGKSRLAELVGTMVNGNIPKIVTASPSWTSGEIVGRYFPRHGDAKLRFHPGVFLQALEENCCLVIDEINRANLDECMGELFTVLAGQSVDLPYMDTIDDYEESTDSEGQTNNEKIGYVKIIPTEAKKKDFPDNAVYLMNDGFRLIGTMNDSDRSALHNLSFALLRRFDVVKITMPSLDNIKNIADEVFKNHTGEIIKFKNESQEYSTTQIKSTLQGLTNEIFCTEDGFVKNNVVGISMMIDVVNFCLKAFEVRNYNGMEVKINNNEAIKLLAKSIFALSLSIKLLPQLDSLNDERFKNTIEKIKNTLSGDQENPEYHYIDEEEENNFICKTISGEKISQHFLKKVKSYYDGSIRQSIINNVN